MNGVPKNDDLIETQGPADFIDVIEICIKRNFGYLQ